MKKESIVESRKNFQRNKMLNVIRTNTDVSRNDIHKLTKYSMTTVLSMVEDMIAEGMIYEEECGEARIGRKPVWLRLNPQSGYFLGIEWNRMWAHCVILDFTGRLVYEQEKVVDESCRKAEAIVELLKNMIREAIASTDGGKEKIIGIGLGVPGYSNQERGIVLSYNYFDEWNNIPIRQIMEEEFQLPCYMGNNVNVMIYAYKWLVFQGYCEDMLFVSVRTGARVMPVINNQAISSTYGYSGELGHVKLSGGSRICACGKYGCLNSEVSDFAILSKIREGIELGKFRGIAEMAEGKQERVTMEMFRKSVLLGHTDSLILLEQVCRFLGEALGMLVNIFAPQRIVMYGELASIGAPFLERLKEYVKKDAISQNLEALKIEASEFGRNLGAMGAAALVLQESFEFLEEMI